MPISVGDGVAGSIPAMGTTPWQGVKTAIQNRDATP